MRKPILGVLGGMGPLATAYFMELVIALTPATRDQDHLPMIVWNDPQIPDRTAHLLDPSKPDPLPCLKAGAKALERAGVSYIAMPCNTSHAYLEDIARSVSVPMLDMVSLCADEALARFGKGASVSVLATDGTLCTGVYQRALAQRGLVVLTPDEALQTRVMELIYSGVKANRDPDPTLLVAIGIRERSRGASGVISGCTELSVLYRDLERKPSWLLDAMELLAKRCVSFDARYNKELHEASSDTC